MLVNNIDLRVEYLGADTTSLLVGNPVSTFLPWVLNPDLTNETEAIRSQAATRGVDNRNNVEKASIAVPAAGRYRITVTHSGALPVEQPFNPSPQPATAQIVSVVAGGVTALLPTIDSLTASPTLTEYLLTYSADPNAVFTIQSSPDLVVWTDEGSVLSVNQTNTTTVMRNAGDDKRFWRMRRGQ